MRTVTELLDALADGRMTVEAVAADFAGRAWPKRRPATEAQVYGVADDAEPDPDSWDAVNADSRLTAAQYATLSKAYQNALTAGNAPAGGFDNTAGTDMADKTTTKANGKGPAPAAPDDGSIPVDGQGDCPDGQYPDPDTGECVPVETPMAAELPEHFHAVMHVEDVSTGKRRFTAGALTWREPPFAFHWQRHSSAHNGDAETVQVGNVTRAERDADNPNMIHGWGRFDLGCPEGLDYARRLVEGWARWVSIGLDESLQSTDVEYVWPDDNTPDGEEPGVEVLFAEPSEIIFHAGRIAELSGVSTPAQQEAIIEPTPALVDALAQLGVLTAAAVGSHSTATSSSDSWDGPAAEKKLDSPMPVATARKMYAWVDNGAVDGGKVPKSGCKFPHHDVGDGGTPGAANMSACSAIIAAVHGARGGSSIPDGDRRGVYNHARAHLVAGGRPADSIPDFQSGPLVAAGYTITIPDCPPAAWFAEPTDVPVHGALTVTDEGRVYGYLAPAHIAHRSFRDRRVEVPMGRVDYTRWMGGEALVAGGGRVVAGCITMECGHLPPAASSDPVVRADHYENSCSVVAKAAIGENRSGVWIAGALEPGVTAEQVSRMMACRLSGDWAPHPEKPGWQEFVAALLVPVPGFPMGRTAASVRIAEGALVASAVPVQFVNAGPAAEVAGPDLQPVLERIARSIGRDTGSQLAALRERVHRGEVTEHV